MSIHCVRELAREGKVIKHQLHDTNKDDISKAYDISVEVDDFKGANEAFENQGEVCNDEKVKTEPDEFQ